MIAPLTPGEHTFTREQISRVLDEGRFRPRDGIEGKPGEFISKSLSMDRDYVNNKTHVYSPNEVQKRAEQLCEDYSATVEEPLNHWGRLDASFSELITCNFMAFETQKTSESIIEDVYNLLSRLPATPVPVDTRINLAELDGEYFSHRPEKSDSLDASDINEGHKWENSRVTTAVSTNVIRVAIELTKTSVGNGNIGLFIDLVADLLTIVSTELANTTAAGDSDCHKYFLIQAFLWTTWQRVVMLYFWWILKLILDWGYDYDNDEKMIGLKRVLNVRARSPEMQFGFSNTPYMCPWAFELLCSDRVAILQDFRVFHARFNAIFTDRPPRCRQIGQNGAKIDLTCDGSSPEACHRFQSMKVEDQSAHVSNCGGNCAVISWDEISYKSVERGGRAVSLKQTNERFLRYCPASKTTLVISHVWSHGQGGRPEDGFNYCLHQRYAAISQALGCDSYWMDTPCIPDDYGLRNEAIANINRVFSESKATLICDRDLMDIDVSNLTVSLRESILATLLVCDWNVRSWTLLEGMRGRRNVHILCRNNRTVSLSECLDVLLHEGRLDFIYLLLAAQQFIPYFGQDSSWDNEADPSTRSQIERMKTRGIKGRVTVEVGSCLLSHRHASRPGDEVVIWSLLISDSVHRTAVNLWQSLEGQMVQTGFLMSSLPRIKGHKGLGWAPSRPNFPPHTTSSPADPEHEGVAPLTQRIFPSTGYGTSSALITPKGLDGPWHVFEIEDLNARQWLRKIKKKIQKEFQMRAEIREGVPPAILTRLREQNVKKRVALIQPAFEHVVFASGALWEDMARSSGPYFAVVSSSDGIEWEWKEVIRIESATTLIMRTEQLLLV
ncbi:hypothetical protein UA08_03689 [Talaromyces atroroseus]|uniref:Heterokaryon incompatibility domain-containing protein n=1 Tax=Talaromyces atroroseus TaxID=1441469 RepID=A0A225AZ25_TALAT|nr:hypothetical protein UA08_03689 [Talaromyces atroroseus]OKL60969.1 hypothetical protein UA08_03689 [Talaromyces atroroseus]